MILIFRDINVKILILMDINILIPVRFFNGTEYYVFKLRIVGLISGTLFKIGQNHFRPKLQTSITRPVLCSCHIAGVRRSILCIEPKRYVSDLAVDDFVGLIRKHMGQRFVVGEQRDESSFDRI